MQEDLFTEMNVPNPGYKHQSTPSRDEGIHLPLHFTKTATDVMSLETKVDHAKAA